jgi:hypothetical protein
MWLLLGELACPLLLVQALSEYIPNSDEIAKDVEIDPDEFMVVFRK